MKTDVLVTLRLLTFVVLGELWRFVSADSQNGDANAGSNNDYNYNFNYHENANNNDGGYSYNSNYGGYNYGGGVQEPGQPEYDSNYPTSISCFVCVLHKRQGHLQGEENCQDPFVRLDMPAVDCKGPCGKVYHQHGENEFLITRSCLPNCKEHRDDKSYTQCCHKPYCNRTSSIHPSSRQPLGLWIMSVLLTLWLLRHKLR